jgi:hypothetical protein
MRYTKYIQECISVLEQEREYETDTRLVALVHIQHLTERISQLNAPDDPIEEVPGLPTAPMSAYVSAFHTELDKIRLGLPHDLQNDSQSLMSFSQM